MSSAKLAAPTTDYRYTLDEMSEHDLLEVVAIEETCGLSRWGWDGYRGELGRPETIMLVARLLIPDGDSGASILGFVSARVTSDLLHVNNIGVVEELRRAGIGGRLLRAALKRGVALGARSATLEVRAGNVAAQALYGGHGFAIVGRRKNYYRNPQEDALVMSASLTAIA